MAVPVDEERSTPRAAPWLAVIVACKPEKSPPRILILLGPGSESGIGSIVRTNVVADASMSISIENVLCDKTPLALTVNVPVLTGAPSTMIQPSY